MTKNEEPAKFVPWQSSNNCERTAYQKEENKFKVHKNDA